MCEIKNYPIKVFKEFLWPLDLRLPYRTPTIQFNNFCMKSHDCMISKYPGKNPVDTATEEYLDLLQFTVKYC